MGPESEEKPWQEVCYCYKAGKETGAVDLEEWRSCIDLPLSYLLYWLKCPVTFQAMSVGGSGWAKVECSGKGI